MSETKSGSGLKRWLARIGVAVLVICVVAAILLVTGIPQKMLIQRAVGRALNANVTVSAVTLLNKVKIGELTAYDKGTTGAPSIDVKGLEIDYALRPPDKRNITAVHIDSLKIQRGAQSGEGLAARPRPAKKRSSFSGGSFFGNFRFRMPEIDPERFVPKTVDVAALEFGRTASSFGMGIDAPRLSAAINRPDDFTAGLKGDKVTAYWWAGSADAERKFPGTLDIHVQKSRGDTVLDPLRISFPGFLDVAGVFRIERKGKDTLCNVNLEKAVAQDLDFSKVSPGDMYMPFAFKRLDLSGTKIQGPAGFDMNGFKALSPAIAIKLAADDLKLGPKDHEIYEGPLHLDVTGKPGDVNIAIDAALNHGQKIHAALSGPVMDLASNIHVEGWSKEDLLAALPKDDRPAWQGMPITGLTSADFNGHLKLVSLEYQASVKPTLANTQAPVEFQAKGAFSVLALTMGGGPSASALTDSLSSLTAKVADGSASFEKQKQGPPSMPNHWVGTFENVAPAQWIKALSGSDLLAGVSSPLKGTVDIQADAPYQTIQATMNFSQGLVADAASLKQLAALLTKDRASADKATAPLEGKSDIQPFTSGKLTLTRKDGGITGEVVLKGKTLDLTLPILVAGA